MDDDLYFKLTPPEVFIKDLRDIVADGDNLEPTALLADVKDMLEKFVEQHPALQRM